MKCEWCGKEYKENEGYEVVTGYEYTENGDTESIVSNYCSLKCRNYSILTVIKNVKIIILKNLEKCEDEIKKNEKYFNFIDYVTFNLDGNDLVDGYYLLFQDHKK
jgi:hypothetical protein